MDCLMLQRAQQLAIDHGVDALALVVTHPPSAGIAAVLRQPLRNDNLEAARSAFLTPQVRHATMPLISIT